MNTNATLLELAQSQHDRVRKLLIPIMPELKEVLESIEFRLCNRMTKTAGTAGRDGLVKLSTKILTHPTTTREQAIDTILHEMGHILAQFPEDTHGKAWRGMTQFIGGSGNKYHHMAVTTAPKKIYTLECRDCGKTFQVVRRKWPTRLANSRSHRSCIGLDFGGQLRIVAQEPLT